MSTPTASPLDFPEIDCLIDEGHLSKPRISASLDNIGSLTVLPPRRPHRHSCQIGALETPRRHSSSRKSSTGSRRRRESPRWPSPEHKAREKKRRRAVYVVIGTFLFILFSCVLVVIVTLTHQTEVGKKNNTQSYYTFSPPPDIAHKPTTTRTKVPEVRKENEELMNSLDEESTNHDSLQNLTAVPLALK